METNRMEAHVAAETAPLAGGTADEGRAKVAASLSGVLADTYTLYLQTHYFHWNVTGPQFRTLHVMFEEEHRELWAAVDLIAERIRALGRRAPGTYAEFTRLTSITEDEAVPTAETMIERLASGHEIVARTARKAIATADTAGDVVSVDLLTQRIAVHETTTWMLRSMLPG